MATADSDSATLTTMRQLIDEHKVDGFILPRTLVDDPRSALLKEQEVPFVMFGRTRDSAGCAWYDVRSEDSMADAVQRLAALGHRRIAFVNGGSHYQYSRLRLDGFRWGLARAGIEEDPSLVLSGALAPEAGEAAGEFPARPPAPTDRDRVRGRCGGARPLPRCPAPRDPGRPAPLGDRIRRDPGRKPCGAAPLDLRGGHPQGRENGSPAC